MKRIPILNLLLSVLFLGGLLLGVVLWYPDWLEATALGLVLLALVTLQVILVRRHLFNLPPGRTEWAMPASPGRKTAAKTDATSKPNDSPAAQTKAQPLGPSPEGSVIAPQPVSDPMPGTPSSQSPVSQAPASQTPVPRSPAPTEPGSATGDGNIDASLFSRFRAHLEEMEKEGPKAPTGTPARPGPASAPRKSAAGTGASGRAVSDEDGEVVARVQLSSRSRQGGPTPPSAGSGKSPSLPEDEGEGPDLFADLRPSPPPATPQPVPTPPAETSPATYEGGAAQTPAADSTAPEPKQHPPETSPGELRPGEGNGGSEATRTDPASELRPEPPHASQESTSDLLAEAATLLRLAEEAANRQDWDSARAGLENYLAHLAESPQLIDWRGHQLQVRLAVRDGDANRALQGFEGMLKAGHRPTVETTPEVLDGLLAEAREGQADSLRVSMLVRILALFRQRRDQRAMDIAYGWIEEAQEKVGDERRLLQYLRNHLEIRKSLGDIPGQLELIDQLGNRCFQLGLTEEAQTYYTLGLQLRGKAEEDEPEPLN